MQPPASRLVDILKAFQEHCDDRVLGAVAFSGYLVTQKDALDRVLLNGDGAGPDDESIALYSTMATQVLDDYKDSAIKSFVPNFEIELRSRQIDELRSRFDERAKDIEGHITRRTDLKSAIFANLAAWCVSILITAAVIVVFLLPGLEDSLADRLSRVPTP